MSWSNPLPAPTVISGVITSEKAFSALQAKHTDAANWATWAATLMQEQTTAITTAIGTGDNTTSAAIASLNALISAAPDYTAGSLDFTNTAFTDSLLTSLKARLTSDISAYNTGLGAAVETAMFTRASDRMTAERANAYAEVTAQFSADGFDVPPGAVTAKQTEINNESSRRLADVNKDILHETTTLAQQYNIAALQTTVQLITLLGQLNDSQMMRNFEIQKVAVMQTLDAYRAKLGLYELKGGLVAKSAQLSIETALRSMTVEVESFKGVAQAAAQMVASALNGVNVSAGFGFSGSESANTTKSQTQAQQLTGTNASGVFVPMT